MRAADERAASQNPLASAGFDGKKAAGPEPEPEPEAAGGVPLDEDLDRPKDASSFEECGLFSCWCCCWPLFPRRPCPQCGAIKPCCEKWGNCKPVKRAEALSPLTVDG